MAKTVGFMGTIPVKPDGAVGTYDDHAVYNDSDHEVPGKVLGEKKDKEREHRYQHKKADEGDPVPATFEDIHPGKGLRPELFAGRNDQGAIVVFPAIRRSVEEVVNKRVLGH